jgi:hypothetical protein
MRLKSFVIDGIAGWIAAMRHPEHSTKYRNFIKYYYVNLLDQYRYAFHDHVLRTAYRTVEYDGEFGPELKYAVPFAYWHHCNGTLKKTVSSIATKQFYFFSENHEEKHTKRTWRKYLPGIPNSEDHNIKYNLSRWRQVPFKEHYKNSRFVFPKPILIVANKYNTEWKRPPVNYLGVDLLREIFGTYSGHYQIIYNRAQASRIVGDNSDILPFDDYRMIEAEFPEVIDMNKLYEEVKSQGVENYNHLQLLLYANSERFVSVHGGASVLASYFGGVNVIYSVEGFEHYFDEFPRFYPKLSGARIFVARSNAEVLEAMRLNF